MQAAIVKTSMHRFDTHMYLHLSINNYLHLHFMEVKTVRKFPTDGLPVQAGLLGYRVELAGSVVVCVVHGYIIIVCVVINEIICIYLSSLDKCMYTKTAVAVCIITPSPTVSEYT